MPPKAIFNWSTGKDSALALYRVLESGEYDVGWLLTTVNTQHDRVSMHGVRTALLEAQAAAIGIPLIRVALPDTPTMEAYEQAMTTTLTQLRDQGAEVSIFGDIFLEDLRVYRERRLAELALRAVFPLWQQPTDALARTVIALGFRAITTCVNERWLDRGFAGRLLDIRFLNDLPSDVDPCGENGEFHTFVHAGPIFKAPIPITIGEIVHRIYERPPATTQQNDSYACQSSVATTGNELATRNDDRQGDSFNTGFWYCDLLPATPP